MSGGVAALAVGRLGHDSWWVLALGGQCWAAVVPRASARPWTAVFGHGGHRRRGQSQPSAKDGTPDKHDKSAGGQRKIARRWTGDVSRERQVALLVCMA